MLANVIIIAAIAAVCVIGIRRMVGGLKGQGCCSGGGEARPRVKRVRVEDTDEENYPYAADLHVGGMSCEGCAENVQNALNALSGTWARVDLASSVAHVLSKQPIDDAACEQAVRDAGYFVVRA